VDAGTLSALLIGAASLVGWLTTQSQARSRAQRLELRGRRSRDLLKDRYLYALEESLAKRNLDLPTKPAGLEKAEGEEW
jgi:hypothetical protein